MTQSLASRDSKQNKKFKSICYLYTKAWKALETIQSEHDSLHIFRIMSDGVVYVRTANNIDDVIWLSEKEFFLLGRGNSLSHKAFDKSFEIYSSDCVHSFLI